MLTTLSTAELRAVIAHELAHFSSAHDAFAAWVYRTRRSWLALRASLDQRLATPIYVYWLVRWYVPRLNAASAEVARRHEFMADRVAAEVGGSRAAADALVVFESGARFADETHWPAIQTSHETAAEPPRPYSQMLTWNARITATDALECARRRRYEPSDTHPSLRERLARLGEEARIPPPAARSAGEEILGTELERLAAQLDQDWMARNGESWTRATRGVCRAAGPRSIGWRPSRHPPPTNCSSARTWSRSSTAQTRRCRSISPPPSRVTRRRAWRPVACSSIEGTRRASRWSKPPWIATSAWCRTGAGFSRGITRRPTRCSRLESANGARPGTRPRPSRAAGAVTLIARARRPGDRRV